MTPRLSVLLAASLSPRSMAGSGRCPAAIGANSQNRNAIVSPIGMRKGVPKSERGPPQFRRLPRCQRLSLTEALQTTIEETGETSCLSFSLSGSWGSRWSW